MKRATQHSYLKMHRIEAWHDQNHRCKWCLKPLSYDDVTAEHMRPKSRGGLDDKSNIAAACADCNLARGNTSPTIFKRILSGGLPCPTLEVRMVIASRRISKRTDVACKNILRLVA